MAKKYTVSLGEIAGEMMQLELTLGKEDRDLAKKLMRWCDVISQAQAALERVESLAQQIQETI